MICVNEDIDNLVQDCSNPIANTLELLQSCTKPSIRCSLISMMKFVPKGPVEDKSASHYIHVKWISWRLKLLVSWVFVQHFVYTEKKKTSKVSVNVLLWRESTGDWWIPAKIDSNVKNVAI